MWCADKEYRIQPVLLQGGAAKVVKDISKQAQVGIKVKVYAVLKFLPAILCLDALIMCLILL